MEQTNEMLTISEAQDILGIPLQSIKNICQKGKIPGAKRQGGTYYVPQQWVEKKQKMLERLTVSEAHKILGWPRQSLQALCRMGQVPGVELIGKVYYIPSEWVEENKEKGYEEFKRQQRNDNFPKESKRYKLGRRDGRLSFRQAAEIIGESKPTIRKAIKKGQIVLDDGSISHKGLEKYIEFRYNPTIDHNILSITFAAQILGVTINVIVADIKAGKVTLLKNKKINMDELESVLKTGDGLTTKEAAVKAKVPRSAIYLALTVGQINYNNGAGINVGELTDFAKNCPLAGYTEQPPTDNDEEASKKEDIKDHSLLTLKEAAELAGVTYCSIFKAIRKGTIQKTGKAIKREEIIKYMQIRQNPQADFGRLTHTEAAQIVGVPVSTIFTAIRFGKITTSGRGITPDELLLFLKKRKLREFGYIDEETLSIPQAAKIAGVTRQAFYIAVNEERLKTANGGIPITEFKRYIKASRGIDIDVPPVPDVELESVGFLNMTEAAQIAGVRLSTLYNAVNSGRLRKFGKYVLRSDLDKYIVWHSSPQRFVGKRQDKEDKDENLLTTAECAQMAGVSTRAINLAVKNGRIQKQGKYIHIEEIKNYIATRRKKHLTKKENKNDNA